MKTTCRRRGRTGPDKKVDANICNTLLKAEVKWSTWLQNCKHRAGIWGSSPHGILEMEVVVLGDRWMAKARRVNTFHLLLGEPLCPTGSL